MTYDGRSGMVQVFTFLKSVFSWAFSTVDSIYLLGNFSMLDFFIALLLLGAILPILIKVVSNYSSRSINHVERSHKDESK